MGYAIEMEEGRWKFNGESIQFDWNEMLQNGQHRLLAIQLTGLSQKFVIVRGLEPEAQSTMDQGTRRSPSDQLKVSGIEADKTLAAAIRVFIKWQSDRLFGDQQRAASKVSTTEVVEWAKSHPREMGLLHSLPREGFHSVSTAPSISLACSLAFHLINYEFAEDFFARLTTGTELWDKSPILALRERLRRDRDRAVKLPLRDTIALFILAWNAFVQSRPMAKLQRPVGGAWSPANFPRPFGG
jgi:hypothetical protein